MVSEKELQNTAAAAAATTQQEHEACNNKLTFSLPCWLPSIADL